MSVSNYDFLKGKFKDMRIPVEVLYELDNLKTAVGDRGFKARRAIRGIDKNFDSFKFLQNTGDDRSYYSVAMMPVDDIIIGYCQQNPKATLLTNDISMKIKAAALGIKTETCKEPDTMPESLVEIEMTKDEMNCFNERKENEWDVLPGQYLSIIDRDTQEVCKLKKYLGGEFWEEVKQGAQIKNYLFDITSKDVYQDCAIDSLIEDEFTVIVGPAGTGKTLLSLGYCLKMIKDTGCKVHIFVNPVKTKDSEQLGFYPGSRDEKLLQNFIGSILTNKIGDMTEVHTLMGNGFINIYPFSDIRGIEIAEGDILYITEGQNLSVDLIKLAIQRCAEGSKIIIEGDPFTQVDKESFQDMGNGLKRVIKVFTGTDAIDFSYIKLSKIYRSKMADKAEEL